MDKVKVFTSFLVNSVAATLLTPEEYRMKPPLPGAWEETATEAWQFINSVLSEKERKTFFPAYKKTKEASITTPEQWIELTTQKFRKDMTRDEIWQTAENVVRGWLGEKGIETKG